MSTYTHTTFAQAKTQLALRLGDPNKVFWADEELGLYIKDALRYWGLIAQYWKDSASFTTTSGQPFYTLSSSTSLRTPSVTDTELIKLIQGHLMEPLVGTSWTGTEQFTYQMILDSITRCRNRMLLETDVALQVDAIAAGSPPVDDVSLSENIIDVRRVAWKSAAGVYKTLRHHGPAGRRAFNPVASYTPGTPLTYLISNQPHVSILLSPPSQDAGELQLITSRSVGSPTGQGNTLGIPDDFVPVLRWGVLADLLASEKAQDPTRAAYCESRWQEGLGAAKLAPSLWSMEVNGRPIPISSLAEKDAFAPNWQNTTGTPNSIAAVGIDLVALSPVPDGIHSVMANFTRSPIIPALDSDHLQVGRELMDVLLDYCIHLACFKQGGDMFAQTQGQVATFLKAAETYNQRLRAQDSYAAAESDHSTREERFRPRTAHGV